MKNTSMIKRLALAAVFGTALVGTAMAQPGPGWGGAWCGGGPAMQQRGMGAGPGGYGMGPGGRGGMGPGAWSGRGAMAAQGAVRGSDLTTPEERIAHQIKMRAVKTYDECLTLQTEHRGLLETRAKEKGVELFVPPLGQCDRLKARGLIK